jgi:hypothetical protein
MTFETYEQGRYSGSPVETYLFTYGLGATEYYGYTDAERGFTLGGKTYRARPISRDSISTSGGRTERQDIKIMMSGKEEFLDMFQIYPPDQPISVVISSGHHEDGTADFNAVFHGKVINVLTKSDGQAEVLCRPLWTAANQAGLRRHYQIGCPHVLYGSHCKASETAVTTTAAAFPASNKVTLASGWEGAYTTSKFRGGWLEWVVGANTYRRTILRLSGNTLTLSGPALDLSVGHSMRVVIGCNRKMDDCTDIHNNINNYGGQPWIPLKNPINTNPYLKDPEGPDPSDFLSMVFTGD